MAASEGDVEVEVNDGCIKQTDRSSYYIWQYFTVSNLSEAKKAFKKVVQRLQLAKFATKYSVVAVLPEQLPTFWDVLYQAKLKLEYRHVLQSTKTMTIGEQF